MSSTLPESPSGRQKNPEGDKPDWAVLPHVTPTSRGIWLRTSGSAAQKGGLHWGEGDLGAGGRSLSVSCCPSSASNRVQVSGYCRSAAQTPRYYSDQSLARLAGVAVAPAAAGNGSGERGQVRPGRSAAPPPAPLTAGRPAGARTHARWGLEAPLPGTKAGAARAHSRLPWPLLTPAALRTCTPLPSFPATSWL